MSARRLSIARAVEKIPGSQVLLRHKGAFLLCVILTPLAAGAAHILGKQLYISQARLLLKLGREFMTPVGISGRSTSMYRLNEAINSEIEILSSHELAESVVTDLGMQVMFPRIAEEVEDEDVARQKASEAFLESLGVTGIAESSVIRISFAHEEASVAREALTELVDRFQTRHLEVFADAPVKMAERGVKACRAALDAAEQARSAYRSEHSVYDLAEQRSLMLRRREAIELRVQEVETLQSRLETGPGSTDPEGARTEDFDTELTNLRAEETRLLHDYLPASTAVQAIRAKINAIEFAREGNRRQEADVLDEESMQLSKALSKITEELRTLQTHDRMLGRMNRSVTNAEARLLDAVAVLDAASAQANLDMEQVTSVIVIDRPTLPLEPVGMKLLAKLVLGAFAGILVGGSFVTLMHLAESAGGTTDGEGPNGVDAGGRARA